MVRTAGTEPLRPSSTGCNVTSCLERPARPVVPRVGGRVLPPPEPDQPRDGVRARSKGGTSMVDIGNPGRATLAAAGLVLAAAAPAWAGTAERVPAGRHPSPVDASQAPSRIKAAIS